MKPYLSKFVSLIQGAYVVEIQIINNIIIAHKILHSMNLKSKSMHSMMAVKIDMSKAFYQINEEQSYKPLNF